MNNSQSTVQAAAWMVASVLSILLMTVLGRTITRELNVFLAMEMRSVIAFIACIQQRCGCGCGSTSLQ